MEKARISSFKKLGAGATDVMALGPGAEKCMPKG